MRNIVLYFIISLLFYGCSSNAVYVDTKKKALDIPRHSSDNGFFKTHFELVEVIRIETSKDLLISEIKRLIRYQDKIILLSGRNNTVFIINTHGRIEKVLNKIGAGPGEWKNILDIAVDDESEQILVYNDYEKVLSFNLEGEFLSSMEVKGTFEGMSYDKGKIIFYNKLEGYSYAPRFLKVFHQNTKKWEEIGDANDKIDFPVRSLGRPIVKSTRLWLTAPLVYNFFNYEGDKIIPVYDMIIPHTKIRESLIKLSISNPRKFLSEVSQNKLVYSVHSIRETNDFMIFRSNQEGILIVDKRTNQVFWDKYVEEKSLNMKLNQYYPHDGNDNKIMFVISADFYTKNLQTESNGKDEFSNIKEDDNPILLFYKQKTSKN